MPYSTSRRARERRLRTHYRKKLWTVGIVMLIIGLVLGFVFCVYAVKNNNRVADLVGLSKERKVPLSYDVTPKPTQTTEATFTFSDGSEDEDASIAFMQDDEPEVTLEPEVIAAPTIMVVEATEPAEVQVIAVVEEVTAEPTAEPTEEPTAVPTEEPTAVPTEEPTMEPTVEPTAVPTEEPTVEPTVEPTAEPTAVPTVEPTAEPTAEPTPVPTKPPVIIPYGETANLATEIKADGSARRAVDADSFETLNISVAVKAYKDQAYYQATWGNKYRLQGNEASVELEMTLNGYTGSTAVVPQEVLHISFRGASDEVATLGYQITDKEIQGNTGVTLTSGEALTMYKRYPYDVALGDMVYMVVTTYENGVPATYWFEIIAPEPVATEVPEEIAKGLTIGSQGDEVKRLQAKLIELKLLSGQPDGKFGSYTAEAVKILQGRYGMEKTGVADPEFLARLYQ